MGKVLFGGGLCKFVAALIWPDFLLADRTPSPSLSLFRLVLCLSAFLPLHLIDCKPQFLREPCSLCIPLVIAPFAEVISEPFLSLIDLVVVGQKGFFSVQLLQFLDFAIFLVRLG